MHSAYIFLIFFQILFLDFIHGSLTLYVKEDQCFCLIVRDGLLSGCPGVSKSLSLDREVIGRYTEFFVFLHTENQTAIDTHLYFNKTMAPAFYDRIEKESNEIVKHLWPRRDEVITSSSFSVSFHDALNRDLCVYIYPQNDKEISKMTKFKKNVENNYQRQGKDEQDIRKKEEEEEKYREEYDPGQLYCMDNDPYSATAERKTTIEVMVPSSGTYLIVYFERSDLEIASSSPSSLQQSKRGVVIGYDHALLKNINKVGPQPNNPFTVALSSKKDEEELASRTRQLMIPGENSIIYSHNLADYVHDHKRMRENEDHERSLISTMSSDGIHLFVMAVRSVGRYREAEVMLKSLFANRDKSNPNQKHNGDSSSSSRSRRLLVVHMVVDIAGRLYFENISSILQQIPNVVFIFHDFQRVCDRPLHQFLSTLDMELSSHHSGVAGYCRLFIDDYFSSLTHTKSFDNDVDDNNNNDNNDKSNTKTMNKNEFWWIPSRIISVEIDQLVLGPIEELWNHFSIFDQEGNSQLMVAAAENYEPWFLSRPYDNNAQDNHQDKDEIKEGVDMQVEVGAEVGNASKTKTEIEGRRYLDNYTESLLSHKAENVVHQGAYHGYGIIGGIMMFDLNRLSLSSSSSSSSSSMATKAIEAVKHIQHHLPRWDIRLNDQDVFNLLFAQQPGMLSILPCHFNVQSHARFNTFIACFQQLEQDNDAITNNGDSDNDSDSKHMFDILNVPWNCAKSREKRAFVCEDKPLILHYQATSYRNNFGSIDFYPGYWNKYEVQLTWNQVIQMQQK